MHAMQISVCVSGVCLQCRVCQHVQFPDSSPFHFNTLSFLAQDLDDHQVRTHRGVARIFEWGDETPKASGRDAKPVLGTSGGNASPPPVPLWLRHGERMRIYYAVFMKLSN